MVIFFQNSTTPLFVSLDNLSTLTILDLSLFHSFFHRNDPKNGINLSFLLPLCSFTLALGLFDVNYSSLIFIWGSKDFYVKNVIFIEYSKRGTFSAVPNFSKSIIKNKASFQTPRNQLMIGWKLKMLFPFEKCTKMSRKVVYSKN